MREMVSSSTDEMTCDLWKRELFTLFHVRNDLQNSIKDRVFYNTGIAAVHSANISMLKSICWS